MYSEPAKEVSLHSLVNDLADVKKTYGQKINYLYSMYDVREEMPDGVSNSVDTPGFWPENGLTVYRIVPQHILGDAFCSQGILLNVGANAGRVQVMLVEAAPVHPELEGYLRYRYQVVSTDSWTPWETLATHSDLQEFYRRLNSGEFIIERSRNADKLTVPVNISVDGVVEGTTVFDGSKSVVIDTTSEKLMPLNMVIEAQFVSPKAWVHLCTLPASAGVNHDIVRICGHIGGWTPQQGKATIEIVASNRDGWNAHGFFLGTVGNVDVVMVDDDATDELKIYAEINGFVGKCTFTVYGDQVILVNQRVSSIPSTLVWRLSTDAINFIGLKSSIQWVPSSEISSKTETIKIEKASSGVHYIVTVDGPPGNTKYGDKFYIDFSTGRLYAPTFVGNVVGNADTSTIARMAETLRVIENANIKATVIGNSQTRNAINGFDCYYDPTIYLTVNDGEIHAPHYKGTDVQMSSLVKAPDLVATASTTTPWIKLANSPRPYIDWHYNNSSGRTFRLQANSDNLECTADIMAPNFRGYLIGNAQYLDVANSNSTKAYVVGITGTSSKNNGKPAYYDSNVYLESSSGGLHAVTVDCTTINATTGNITTVNATTGNITYVYATQVKIGGQAVLSWKDGKLDCNTEFKAVKVHSAIWNDYAEFFPRGGATEAGDVIVLDVTSAVERYVKSSAGNTKTVVGVHSDEYAHIIGGEVAPTGVGHDEHNIAKYIPVAVAGRVRVKFTGNAVRGGYVVAADDGCARLYNPTVDSPLDVFGLLVEEDLRTDVRRLRIKLR